MSSVACPGCRLPVLPPPGVPMVACPRCGTAFAVPAAAPPALPTAEVVRYQSPLAPPEEYTPPPPSSMTIGSWLKVLFVLAIFAGAAGYGYWEFYLRDKPIPEAPFIDDVVFTPSVQGKGQVVRSDNYNFRFDLPGAPWEADAEIKKAFPSCIFAMHRGETDGLAVWVKDFQSHTPRDSVVQDEGITRLNKVFKGLSYDVLPDVELGGRKTMHVAFKGERAKGGGGKVAGDCFLFAHQGIAYGLVAWAPQLEDNSPLWKGFALLDKREDWAEQRAKAQTLPGNKLTYSLQDPYAVWTKDADLLGYTGADLALLARDPIAPRYLSNAATVIVLLPPSQPTLDDAITYARQQMEKAQTKDYPSSKVNFLAGQDVRLNVGAWKGLVSKFHVFSGDSRQRFVVQAVFQRGSTAIVVQCECPWQRRSFWERDFDEIVRTFRMD